MDTIGINRDHNGIPVSFSGLGSIRRQDLGQQCGRQCFEIVESLGCSEFIHSEKDQGRTLKTVYLFRVLRMPSCDLKTGPSLFGGLCKTGRKARSYDAE